MKTSSVFHLAEQLQFPYSELENQNFEVHCFFGCSYVASSPDTHIAHDRMERHYTQRHSRQIERIIARYGVSK